MEENYVEILVTVVMPAHNAELFIADSIQSILKQTHKNFELIIINDGSTDSTGNIIDLHKESDKRVKVIKINEPMGYGGEKACNLAYKEAEGKYIAKLDADDLAEPDRLKKQICFLEQNKDIFLVGSWVKIIDQSGNEKGTRSFPISHQNIWTTFYLKNCIAHPSIMFRNYIVKDDFYKIEFAALNDYYTHFIHMHRGLKMANLPEYLVKYRIHDNNTTYSKLKQQWKANIAIKRSFVKDFGYIAPLKHKLMIWLIDWIIYVMPQRFLIALMTFSRYITGA